MAAAPTIRDAAPPRRARAGVWSLGASERVSSTQGEAERAERAERVPRLFRVWLVPALLARLLPRDVLREQGKAQGNAAAAMPVAASVPKSRRAALRCREQGSARRHALAGSLAARAAAGPTMDSVS